MAAAGHNLTADWREESPTGQSGFVTPRAFEALLKEASLTIKAPRGVRVIADYLPKQISRFAEYERNFALERRLGKRREFLGVARYMRFLASHATRGWERGE